MDITTDNTSGQGTNAVVPREIQGWNWGAFLLTWIWGLGNNVLIALLTLIPFVGLVMMFVLGIKGNEWAWQQKRWDSVEHFKRVQRAWTKWGVIIALVGLVVVAVFFSLIFFVITATMKGSEPYRTGIDRLHADASAMAELGAPVTAGIPSGTINTSDGSGHVNFRISVHGSNKSGVLYIDGEESEGQWQYQRIDLVVDGKHVDLDADGSPASDDGR